MKKTPEKKRLDRLLVEREFCATREAAQGIILAGKVWNKEKRLDKPGVLVNANIELRVEGPASPFVSRAGEKLRHGLERFALEVKQKVCLDVGASTGGFTDCLLQRGAKKVFAVDVGYGQLDIKLRQHPRVINIERTNARHLTAGLLGDHPPIDLIVVDVSFISLRLIIEPLAKEFPETHDWLLLFKPQFEVGRKFVGKGGIVSEGAAVTQALDEFDEWMRLKHFFRRGGPEASPLKGKKSGNLEYLILYEKPESKK